MRKERFEEFCNAVYDIDCTTAGSEIVLRPKSQVKVCLYLSKEKDAFIEYGDFSPEELEHELRSIFKADGYLNETNCVTDKVHEMLAWQVWLKFYERGGFEPYAGVYLFDFTDNGISEVNESYNFDNIEE